MFRFGFFPLIFLVGLFAPANRPATYAQQHTSDFHFNQCNPGTYAFRDGEELVYRLYYSLPPMHLSAGEVTFRVEDVGDKYIFTAFGRTYKGYEWFFKVRDYYRTEVDKATLRPLYAIRDIMEGNYKMYEEVRFDHEGNKVWVRRGTDHNHLDDGEELEVSECISDVLSLLYALRTADTDRLRRGDEIPMRLFIDKEEFSLKMTYKGKNPNKKIPGLGRFRTKVFEPQVVKGSVFKDESGMRVWVSDDANQVPMLIKSPVSVGSVKAVLKSYKNLRY